MNAYTFIASRISPPGTPDAVQVLVRSIVTIREIVIHHDINPLDVDTTSEQIRRHQDTLLEILELLVSGRPDHAWGRNKTK